MNESGTLMLDRVQEQIMHMGGLKCLNLKRGRSVFLVGRNVFPRVRNVSLGGETS